MQYMGGKGRQAKHVVAAILADTDLRGVWYEPFCGSCFVTAEAAPHFVRLVAADAHPDLIMMWLGLQSGWVPPDSVTREEYAALRHAEPSALRAFVGFGCSFGGKWFGGYASNNRGDDFVGAARRGCLLKSSLMGGKTEFYNIPFGTTTPPPGTVVYCDPPYAGTTGYATGAFDHGSFYATLREWAVSCPVYVSEYTDPIGAPFREVWRRAHAGSLKRGENARPIIERLFRILPE